jgi:hypothetical protein
MVFERLSQDASYWRQIAGAGQSQCLFCKRGLSYLHDEGCLSSCGPCKIMYGDRAIGKAYCPYCHATLWPSGNCSRCGLTYTYSARGSARFDPSYDDAGCLLPVHKDHYQTVQISVPNFLSDPTHVAHILWMFCLFVESLGGNMVEHLGTKIQSSDCPQLLDQLPRPALPELKGPNSTSKEIALTNPNIGVASHTQNQGNELSDEEWNGGDY